MIQDGVIYVCHSFRHSRLEIRRLSGTIETTDPSDRFFLCKEGLKISIKSNSGLGRECYSYDMDDKRNNVVVGIIVATLLLALIGGMIALFVARDQSSSITNFQDCVQQGYLVTKGNPEKCMGPNGRVFTGPKSDEGSDRGSGDDQQPSVNPPVQNSDKQMLSLLVYVSKDPESLDDFTYTQAIDRSSNRIDVGTYTIEQLITGPTEVEASTGLFSPLKGKLQGESNCAGKDFTLAVANRIARLKFCRLIASGGIGDDARITTTVTKTLEQFSSVDSVTIMTRDGNCFGDLSGRDQCHK